MATTFSLLIHGATVTDGDRDGGGPGAFNDSLRFLAIDPFLMPFRKGPVASDQASGVSAIHRPVGTNLTTEAIDKPITQFTVNHTNGFTRWFWLAPPSAPIKVLGDNGRAGSPWNLPWTMRIADGTHGHPDPTETAPNASRDSGTVILAKHPTRDEWHMHECFAFENIAAAGGGLSNTYQAQIMFTDDPDADAGTNPSHPPKVRAVPEAAYAAQGHLKTNANGTNGLPKMWPTASNISYVYKLLRKHELETPGFPIRHGLCVTLSVNSVQKKTGSAYNWRWPATTTDGSGTGSQLQMGDLLVIPASVDVTALGLSEMGVRIARAMQRYGMIVIDTGTNASVSGHTKITWSLEDTCLASTKTALDTAFGILFPSNPANAIVRRATNSVEAQSVSGGGSPLITHLPNVWNAPGTGHTVSDGVNTWRFGAVL